MEPVGIDVRTKGNAGRATSATRALRSTATPPATRDNDWTTDKAIPSDPVRCGRRIRRRPRVVIRRFGGGAGGESPRDKGPSGCSTPATGIVRPLPSTGIRRSPGRGIGAPLAAIGTSPGCRGIAAMWFRIAAEGGGISRPARVRELRRTRGNRRGGGRGGSEGVVGKGRGVRRRAGRAKDEYSKYRSPQCIIQRCDEDDAVQRR